MKVEIQRSLELELPTVPNLFRVKTTGRGTESVSTKDISKEDLEKLAELWKNELLKKAGYDI